LGYKSILGNYNYDNYLYVSQQDKILAGKARYSNFEKVFLEAAPESLRNEYARIRPDLVSEGRTIVLVARVGFGKEREVTPLEACLEYLDDGNNSYRLEGNFKNLENYVLFPNQMIAVEGTIQSSVLIINKIFSSIISSKL